MKYFLRFIYKGASETSIVLQKQIKFQLELQQGTIFTPKLAINSFLEGIVTPPLYDERHEVQVTVVEFREESQIFGASDLVRFERLLEGTEWDILYVYTKVKNPHDQKV